MHNEVTIYAAAARIARLWWRSSPPNRFTLNLCLSLTLLMKIVQKVHNKNMEKRQ